MGPPAIFAVGAVLALLLLLVVLYQRWQIARLVARLGDASRTDGITGLLNRQCFEELLDTELERSRRTGRPLALIVGSLDGLDAVNAEKGHEAGESALRLVADDIKKWKRRMDSAARIGGQEFALILPEADERGAFLVAERLRRAAHRSFLEGPGPVTLSFGVVSCPEHGGTRDLLMSAALRALAAARQLGKDRSVIYSPEVARLMAGVDFGEAAELELTTVIGLAEALDIRDSGTPGHCHTVGRYAELIARDLGLAPEHVERVRLAGVVHDVGKVGVSELLMLKPAPLDPDEWREMHTHPEIGARLLAHRDFDDLRSWVLAHHERPDGNGYPHGLPDEEIPLAAKIIAVADAYESMTADRAHRPALGDEAARAELEAGAGTQFDERVVTVFLHALDRLGAATLPQAS
jgi:diguanylate cyclase (GGDEF)-like protein